MSAFVECPICACSVHHLLINDHIDSACAKHAADSDEPASKRPRVDEPAPAAAAAASATEPAASAAPAAAPAAAPPDARPLAERMRPRSLDEFVGQADSVGRGSALRSMLGEECGGGGGAAARPSVSLVLWGPPGCGKSTFARLVRARCDAERAGAFVELSATSAGVKEVRAALDEAAARRRLLARGARAAAGGAAPPGATVLFLDEIHRFSKAQQDVLLPAVERGVVVLLGATTENPSFSLNAALLSRARVVALAALADEDVRAVLARALDTPRPRGLGGGAARASDAALAEIARLASGDARAALNALEIAAACAAARRDAEGGDAKGGGGDDAGGGGGGDYAGGGDGGGGDDDAEGSGGGGDAEGGAARIALKDVRAALQRAHLVHDRAGDAHYDCVSALHKSLRGSDVACF